MTVIAPAVELPADTSSGSVAVMLTAPVAGAAVVPTLIEPPASTPEASMVTLVALAVEIVPAPKDPAVIVTGPEAVVELISATPVLLIVCESPPAIATAEDPVVTPPKVNAVVAAPVIEMAPVVASVTVNAVRPV